MSQEQANAASEAAAVSTSSASDGRLFATLSYIIPLLAIISLIQRSNAFALYHAKQSLTLCVACIAANIALTIVLLLVPVAIVSTLVLLAFLVAAIGLCVLGAVNAWHLRCQPLPVIGLYGENFLRNVTVR